MNADFHITGNLLRYFKYIFTSLYISQQDTDFCQLKSIRIFVRINVYVLNRDCTSYEQ